MFGKRGISGRVGAAAAGVILFLSLNLPAQTGPEAGLPGWVLFEKGLFSYEQGRLDEALEFFHLSAKGGLLTPEATYWIGRIYEEEGDYLLAEKRYLEALEDARFLYVPDHRWMIQYSLANIYLNRRENDRYEQLLLSVFDEEMMRNEEIIRREHSYVQMLKEEGMDKLLLLFRVRLSYALESASQLGVYYARQDAWKSAMIKNLYAVLSYFSAGIEYLMEKEPNFSFPVDMEEAWEADPEFLISFHEEWALQVDGTFRFARDLKTLEPLSLEEDSRRAREIIRTRFPYFEISPTMYVLGRIEREAGLEGFLEEEKLYRALFYLAQSLYNEGFPERAGEVWSLAAMSRSDTPWKALSIKALSDPDIQPPSLIY